MSEHDTPEYITFPRTFENYRWYKPILVFIIGAIVYVILQVAIFAIFGMAYGWNTIFQLMTQGYEALNSEAGSYIQTIFFIFIITGRMGLETIFQIIDHSISSISNL